MADSQNHYVFLSSEKIQQDVLVPIKNSLRIKYTCFHVSNLLIALGSSSGGIYLFQKCPNGSYQYLLTIINNNGAITCVSFCSKDEQIIAASTSRGYLMIFQIDFNGEEVAFGWKTLYEISNFTKYEITILKWHDLNDYQLYLCDENGQVFILHNVKALNRLLVLPCPSVILKLGCKIFQLDIFHQLLLISTENKFCLYDLNEGSLTQIGKKPRSNGQYGVCFFPKDFDDDDEHSCAIYCARPGLRLWEVDLQANVKYTHQFKESLNSKSPSIVYNQKEWIISSTKEFVSSAFAKLQIMYTEAGNFLLAYSNGFESSSIYVIDPIHARVIAWCNIEEIRIDDILCMGNDIYILHHSNSSRTLKIAKLCLLTLDQYFMELCRQDEFIKAAEIVEYYNGYFKQSAANNNIIQKVLKEVWYKIDDNEKENYNFLYKILERENLLNKDSASDYDSQTQSDMKSECTNDSDTESETEHNYSDEFHFNPIANYFSSTNFLNDFDKFVPEIELVDKGVGEFVKFKENVMAKLSNVTIKPKISFQNLFEERTPSKLSDRSMIESSSVCSSSESSSKHSPEIHHENDIKSPSDLLNKLHSTLKFSYEVNQCKCCCGYPKPFSHVDLSKAQIQVHDLVLQNPDEQFSHEQLLEICYDCAVWSAYQSLLLKTNDFDNYLKISLMICDKRSLDCPELITYLNDKSKIDNLFNMFLKQTSNGPEIVTCIQCENVDSTLKSNLTWDFIARISVKSIGSEQTIDILKKFSELTSTLKLSNDFYLYLFKMQMINSCQSSVTKERLTQLSNYINSITAKTNLNNSDDNSNRKKGFKIHLNRTKCCNCKLSLNQPQLIVAFNCKHNYHKSCLNGHNNCILCVSINNI